MGCLLKLCGLSFRRNTFLCWRSRQFRHKIDVSLIEKIHGVLNENAIQKNPNLTELKLNKTKYAIVGLVLAANGVHAQTSGTQIELYGVLDVAVGKVEHSLSVDPNFPFGVNPVSATSSVHVPNSVTGMFNGGVSDSRWGIRGSEDLGAGMKAVFTLESGFNLPDGALNNGTASLANNTASGPNVSANTSLNGQFFNRAANVGLADSNLGTITFGRNYGPIFDIVVNYDPVQAADLFSPLGFSGTFGGGGGVSEDTRIDNSVRYKNQIGSVNFGGFYKMGGVAGSSTAQSGYGLNMGYEAGDFGIQSAYEEFTDALKTGNSTVAGDINLTNFNTTAFFVAAKYHFGDATIRGGYETYTLKAPSDTLASMGVTSLYGYTVGNASSASANFSAADQTTDIWFIGGDYNFTPSLNLALGFYDVMLKQSSDLKQLDGNAYYYSALLDYHFSKRTDVYAGYMYDSFKGANFSAPFASLNTTNYITAIGIRTKF
jgi:predicted porin